MKNDLIKRQDAIEAVCEALRTPLPCYGNGLLQDSMTLAKAIVNNIPSAEPEAKWIPFTMRELTTEEKEEHPEWEYIMDCELPDDGEEILVSDGKFIWSDTFVNDGDGCYLDGGTDLDGCSWMPLPEPWRGE